MGNTTPQAGNAAGTLNRANLRRVSSLRRAVIVALVAVLLRSLRTFLPDYASATDRVWDPDEPLAFVPGNQASRPQNNSKLRATATLCSKTPRNRCTKQKTALEDSDQPCAKAHAQGHHVEELPRPLF